VIAFEPDFEQITEAAIFGDVFGREMAVVVKNRLGFCILVKETARGLGGQQKIVVDERHRSLISIETYFTSALAAGGKNGD
jgi:hypothetical protein